MNQELIEIRCPFKRTSRTDGITRNCKHLCVKVYPGSSGETYCSRCNLVFEFQVDTQNNHQISSVRIKKDDN